MHFGIGPKTTRTSGNATSCGNEKGAVVMFFESTRSILVASFVVDAHAQHHLRANERTSIVKEKNMGVEKSSLLLDMLCPHLHTPLVCPPRALAASVVKRTVLPTSRFVLSLAVGSKGGAHTAALCLVGRSSSKAFPPPPKSSQEDHSGLSERRFFLRSSIIIYCIPLLKPGDGSSVRVPCDGEAASPLPRDLEMLHIRVIIHILYIQNVYIHI